MKLEEFDSFKGELKQLCASLGKAYTDALGKAYWRVLHDVPLAEIEANVERILLTATKDTKFPRPLDLRTTPTKQAAALPDAAAKLNADVWQEKHRKNRALAEVEMRWCQYQRIIAATHESDPAHAMAIDGARAIERQHGDPRWFQY